jgi:hypothetical protein
MKKLLFVIVVFMLVILSGCNKEYPISEKDDYCWVIGQVTDTKHDFDNLDLPYTLITFKYSDVFSQSFPIWNRDLAALDRIYRYTLKLLPVHDSDHMYYKIIGYSANCM